MTPAQQRPATRILLLRHAQHDPGGSDGGLTHLGRRQAAALAAALSVDAADLVVSSPQPRSIATARFLEVPVTVVTRLREFDFGPSAPSYRQMRSHRDDLALWRACHCWPGGETLGDFQLRVSDVLEELVALREGGRIVAFTHAGVVDAAIRWAYGLPPDADWVTEARLPNASITELHFWAHGQRKDGAPRYTVIRRIGDVAHLGRELTTDF